MKEYRKMRKTIFAAVAAFTLAVGAAPVLAAPHGTGTGTGSGGSIGTATGSSGGATGSFANNNESSGAGNLGSRGGQNNGLERHCADILAGGFGLGGTNSAMMRQCRREGF